MRRNDALTFAILLLAGCDGASIGNRSQRSGDVSVADPENGSSAASNPLEGVGAPMAWQVIEGGAFYGAAKQEAVFALRCDRANKQIIFERAGGGTTLILSAGGVETSLGTRQVEGGRVQARTGMGDAVLDRMARSRAQISVGGGAETLAIPGGVAIRRVLDVCRNPPAPPPLPAEGEPRPIVIPTEITEPAPEPLPPPPKP